MALVVLLMGERSARDWSRRVSASIVWVLRSIDDDVMDDDDEGVALAVAFFFFLLFGMILCIQMYISYRIGYER